MSGPIILCEGSPLSLGHRIGRGGEGEVFAIVDGPESKQAVKIYLQPDARREPKIRAIIASGIADACPNVAFPLQIVRTPSGGFAGFTMQYVTGRQPIHQLFAPGSRRNFFPDADWRFLVRTASNVARIVASVHAQDVVIGDINSCGFLVSQQATVTLIDADSFQFAKHRCPVGMPEYTPPELQRQRFSDVDRNANHDAFGLAVMIFQILFLGRHPFAGASKGQPLPLEDAIVQERFAYSNIRNVRASPPPGTLLLSDLPRAIAYLFERAFALKVGPRPTAAEWARELSILETRLVPCPHNQRHFITMLTVTCPWCRIERDTGRPSFDESIPVATISTRAEETDLHRDARRVIRQVRRDAAEAIEPTWPRASVAVTKNAKQAWKDSRAIRLETFMQNLSPAGPFIARYGEANVAASVALDDWRRELGIGDIYKVSDRLRTSLGEFDRMRSNRSALLTRISAQIVAEMITVRLRAAPVDNAVLVGIGEGVRSHLTQQGLCTAADITRAALANATGLGDARTTTLLFWQAHAAIEAERAVMASDECSREIASAAAARLDSHIAQLERSIRYTINELEQLVDRARARASQIDPLVLDALQHRDQAIADLAHLGIGREACARIVSASTAATTSQSATGNGQKSAGGKRRGPSCPICASSMVKRWSSSAQGGSTSFLGCSRYPACKGRRPVRK